MLHEELELQERNLIQMQGSKKIPLSECRITEAGKQMNWKLWALSRAREQEEENSTMKHYQITKIFRVLKTPERSGLCSVKLVTMQYFFHINGTLRTWSLTLRAINNDDESFRK